MQLFIISTPIGNMGDITIRAKETLQEVDCVLCEDTRVCAKLFMLLDIKKKPMFSYHKFNEQMMCAKLEDLFGKYKKIALVSDAGTPAISDPGAILVNKARAIGVEITSVPGASAVVSAVSLSGCLQNDFVFLGFFPKVKADQKKLINKMQTSGFLHFVFFESPNKILSTLEILRQCFCTANAAVFNDLTKKFERQYTGTLEQVISELKENEKSSFGEYVISLQLKNCVKETKEEQSTIAAALADYAIKNKTNIKQAVDDMAKLGFSKNVLKQAAIQLRGLFHAKN